MHIWHHSKVLSKEFPKGCNFGLSFSLWDYLFKTAYIPNDGAEIELGFNGDESFPKKFIGQEVSGFLKRKN